MNYHSCENFEEVISRIRDDFDVEFYENFKKYNIFLRGENDVYPKTESSMKRFITSGAGELRPFYEISPFIDFEDIFAEFHAEVHGLAYEEGVGFLQHYGFPTDLFDLSPSIDNTRFFACHGCDERPFGTIGVFPREGIEASFILTNLSEHPFALRPRRQSAYAARAPRGIFDLKSDACHKITGSKWFSFRKSKSDHDFVRDHIAWVYPTEAELTHLFSNEFFRFFHDHFAYHALEELQRAFLDNKLKKVAESYRNP